MKLSQLLEKVHNKDVTIHVMSVDDSVIEIIESNETSKYNDLEVVHVMLVGTQLFVHVSAEVIGIEIL